MADEERVRQIEADLKTHKEWLTRTYPQVTSYGPISPGKDKPTVLWIRSHTPLSPADEAEIRKRFNAPYDITFGLGKPRFHSGD